MATKKKKRAAAQARKVRPRSAEVRCDDYRRAFQILLREPFENLDATLNRMLEVAAATLDVQRVSLWTFDEAHEAIRCEHCYASDKNAPLGATLLRQGDYPRYFDAVAKELVIPVDDALHDRRTSELASNYLQPLKVGSMLDVPVRAFGRYLGILCHEVVGGRREWTREDATFASAVATQIALAFERDRVRAEQAKLLDESLRDEDTLLANRVGLTHALDAYLTNPARTGALAIASIDQFNYIVTSLGGERSLKLKRSFAARMQAAGGEHSIVARLGPNEYALLLRDVPARLVPQAIQNWHAAAKLPLESDGQRLFLTLSLGYSDIHSATASSEDLLAETRVAMTAARQQGGDRVVAFTSAMRREMRDRASLEQDLRRALDAGEFDLDFQPIIPLQAGGRLCFEALLRWRHPRKGVLAPASFMDVALEAGIMLELGRRVLRVGCDHLTRIRQKPGLEQAHLTINMSAPEVLLPGTADAIRSELLRHNLPPECLTIELTETALMMCLDRAAVAIGEIRALGVRISLDDFGTAYSSLSWLRRLPIDQVKIDRSYVSGIEHEEKDFAIVKSVVDLARSFNRDIVAEGVESGAQLELLRDLGVKYAQGYYFARPMPAARLDINQLNQWCLAPQRLPAAAPG
jgi:predicted signal transduction protein with EAL and GGDEF domain